MRLSKKKLNLAACISFAALITYYSLKPVGNTVTGSTGLSAPLLHITAYLVLAASLNLYMHDNKPSAFTSMIIAACLGISIEITQGFLSYRVFSIYDIAANSAGAMIVAADFKGVLSSKIIEFEEKMLENIPETGSPFNIEIQ